MGFQLHLVSLLVLDLILLVPVCQEAVEWVEWVEEEAVEEVAGAWDLDQHRIIYHHRQTVDLALIGCTNRWRRRFKYGASASAPYDGSKGNVHTSHELETYKEA